MVGYKTPDGVEWYSDKEALTVWEILMQNQTAVDAKLWEYFVRILRFEYQPMTTTAEEYF